MDGMARSCGVDIPEQKRNHTLTQAFYRMLEGASNHAAQSARRVRIAGTSRWTGSKIRCSKFPKTRTSDIEPSLGLQSRDSRYSPDAATMVKRIVPMRLISLTCSPTWISTLYRPGFHASCGGESVR